MDSKPWYTSKTLWVNAIAFIALLLQSKFGFVLGPEAEIGIIAIANILLRLVTKHGIGA